MKKKKLILLLIEYIIPFDVLVRGTIGVGCGGVDICMW